MVILAYQALPRGAINNEEAILFFIDARYACGDWAGAIFAYSELLGSAKLEYLPSQPASMAGPPPESGLDSPPIDVMNNLGNALRQLGSLGLAAECYLAACWQVRGVTRRGEMIRLMTA